MRFSRQKYWRGLPSPPPGYLPDPGIEPVSLISPALVDRLFTTSTASEAWDQATTVQIPGFSFLTWWSLALTDRAGEDKSSGGWGPWLSPRGRGTVPGNAADLSSWASGRRPGPTLLPAFPASSRGRLREPAAQCLLLLLRACHHFHTQQGLWGRRLFPDMYLSEERKQGESPRICQVSRQEHNSRGQK